MASLTDVCNQAIGLVGGSRITSIDDGTNEAKQCKTNVYSCIDRILNDADWIFATRTVSASPLSEQPVAKYQYAFQIPNECIKVQSVLDADSLELHHWTREGNIILCDSDIIYIQYTHRIVDISLWPALLVSSLVHLLASRLATSISANNNLRSQMYDIFLLELRESRSADARQSSPTSVGRRSSRLINARRRYG